VNVELINDAKVKGSDKKKISLLSGIIEKIKTKDDQLTDEPSNRLTTATETESHSCGGAKESLFSYYQMGLEALSSSRSSFSHLPSHNRARPIFASSHV